MLTRITAAAALVLLAACGSPAQQSQGASGPGVAVYPAGIAPFKNVTAAYNAGIFAMYEMRGCCFIKQRASLTLDKPARSRVATLHFFVPNAAPYANGQSVTVSVDGASASGSGTSGKWIAVSLSLPAKYISRTAVPVEIVTAKSFNPAKLGINSDTRDLGVVLQRVDYR